MKRIDFRILVGGLMIAAGILFFMQTLNIIPNALGIFWVAAFLIGGGVFIYVYWGDREQWWALIPGMAMFGLAGTILVSTYFPVISNWAGAIFLASVGLGFLFIYLVHREHWWALIPGGVLLTLAAVTLMEGYIDDSGGGVFFVGLSLTFLLVALLGNPKESFWWAYIPAGVLFVLGAIILTPLRTAFNLLWPIALILVGGVLLIRNVIRR